MDWTDTWCYLYQLPLPQDSTCLYTSYKRCKIPDRMSEPGEGGVLYTAEPPASLLATEPQGGDGACLWTFSTAVYKSSVKGINSLYS